MSFGNFVIQRNINRSSFEIALFLLLEKFFRGLRLHLWCVFIFYDLIFADEVSIVFIGRDLREKLGSWAYFNSFFDLFRRFFIESGRDSKIII